MLHRSSSFVIAGLKMFLILNRHNRAIFKQQISIKTDNRVHRVVQHQVGLLQYPITIVAIWKWDVPSLNPRDTSRKNDLTLSINHIYSKCRLKWVGYLSTNAENLSYEFGVNSKKGVSSIWRKDFCKTFDVIIVKEVKVRKWHHTKVQLIEANRIGNPLKDNCINCSCPVGQKLERKVHKNGSYFKEGDGLVACWLHLLFMFHMCQLLLKMSVGLVKLLAKQWR